MLKMTLVTPEKKFVTDLEVEEVIVPGHKGELGILEGHSPLVTTLNVGVLKYKEKGASEYQRAAISWGFCEIHPEGVTILAETAETAEMIDKDRAQNAMKRAEKELNEKPRTIDEVQKYQRKYQRARTRLSLVD